MEINPPKIDWLAEHRLTYSFLLNGIDAMESAHRRFPEIVLPATILKMRGEAKTFKVNNL